MNSKNIQKGSIISAVVLAAAFAFSGIVSADTVTPTNMGNWYFYNDQTDTVLATSTDHGFVTGPGTPPVGTGSAHLTKTTTDKYGIATQQFASTSLSSITALSYSTYRVSGTSAQVPSLGFDVDSNSNDGLTAYEGRLTYEPYFTQTVSDNTWQTWDTLAGAAASSTTTGNWWFSRATLGGSPSACMQSDPCTWAEVLASYPNAAIRAPGQLILRTNGADGEAFDGNVDNLTVGITGSTTTTFDFDPTPVTPPAACNGSTFDSFTLGSVNGQGGWRVTGPYDQEVVSNTYGYTSFGCKTLRISDAVTSGGFGDQLFSPSASNEAGETAASSSSMTNGTRQTHYEAQFDIASAVPGAEQSGLHLTVSPDRGDGQRMSFLRFEDQADGLHVFFDDVTNAGPVGTGSSFNETDIAALDRSVAHSIKFVIDFVDGPSNDVVKIYIDGALVHAGTSWENYYRYDPEQAGNGNEVPTVNSLLFRLNGTANAGNSGNGFLLDNFSEIANAPATSTVTMNTGSATSTSSATNTSGNTVTRTIPPNTTVSGSSNWDGNLGPVTFVTTQGVTPSSNNNTTSSVYSVQTGSSQSDLDVSNAAQITFAGQAGKLVGLVRNNSFNQITTSCSSIGVTNQTTANSNLATTTSCKMDSGADLIVWTKQLGVFTVYTESAATATSGGGGGGGGGGGNGPIITSTTPITGGTTGTTGGSTGTTGTTGGTGGTGGQVLGASTYNFSTNLTMGSTGADVSELQRQLIAMGYSIPAIQNGTASYGYFGVQTRSAVAAYQRAHGITPAVGYFGPITRASFNAGQTPSMSDAQRAALLASLLAQLQALQAKLNAMIAAGTAH